MFRKSSKTPSRSNRTPLPILKSAISLRQRWRRGSCRIAGSCPGLLILQLFVENGSLRNDRTLPAANLQSVSIGVLEEKCIIARTVIGTDFRPFKRLAACFVHQLRQLIHFVARIRPKRDARAVWLMVLIL